MNKPTEKEIIDFIELVVKSIQMDHRDQKDCRTELEKVLNAADDLSERLGNGRIVMRGRRSVLEVITGINRLNKI